MAAMRNLCLVVLLLGLVSPSLAAVIKYNTATVTALLEFKAVLGNTTKASGLPDWGATWIKDNSCSSWTYTTCDASGNLLSLTLVGMRLEGIIPKSFYTITTLQLLDLHNNRLYGNVNRYLADINQNLYYLDLSSNFFSGQYPDQWTNPNIGVGLVGDPNLYALSLNGQPIYVNISNTYFTGTQTINATTPNSAGYPYSCIGSQTTGDSSYSCISLSGVGWSGGVPGDCGFPSTVALPRAKGQCDSFCGAGSTFGLCHNSPGAQCIPTFASATNNTIVSRSCLAGATVPSSPPPPPVSVVMKTSDATALAGILTALGLPSTLLNPAKPCSTLSPYVGCDATGAVTSLNLVNAGLTATLPSGIKSLSSLRTLNLPGNKLYGPFPFVIATDLPNLIYLDLSNNYLSGRAPTYFTSTPLFVNITNNYFSGSPTITDATGGYYCPSSGTFEAQNCLTNFYNSPCPGQAQRTAAACAAFCGIVTVPTLTQSIVGPCNNNSYGICIPKLPISVPLQGLCSGAVVPAPPPPPSSSAAPIYQTQLLWLAGQWSLIYGTPAAVFSTWIRGKPCSTWSGLTCDNGKLIAVSLPNKGIIGPFPGPTFVQDLFWAYNSYTSPVKYIDLSGNKLYGKLDPLLGKVTNIEYLDISRNSLTGTLPATFSGTFKYLNVSNNYFTGSSTVLGLDDATAYCPGTTFAGSLDSNCFDVTPSAAFACPAKAVNRTAAACTAFCGGVSSATPSKNLPKCTAGQSCKPSGTSYICSKS